MALSAHLPFLIVLMGTVIAQYDGSDLTWSATGSTLCNASFSDANATGLYQYTPGVPDFSASSTSSPCSITDRYDALTALLDGSGGFAPDLHVGATVSQTSASSQWSMWYNTGGANYTDDTALGYDAFDLIWSEELLVRGLEESSPLVSWLSDYSCLFTVNTPTTNTFLRGQSDTGDCLSTLDVACNNALTDMANNLVLGFVSNPTPGPNSNLTDGSLSQVCYEAGNNMQDNFPKVCEPFFNLTTGIAVSGSALTSNGTTGVRTERCSLKDTSTNRTFEHLLTLSGTASEFNYLTFNYVVIPFILTWFPIANINAAQSIASANSVTACIRADHLNPGSESVPAPPEPTPIGSGGGLSGGAIAGIVIGVVGGLALIAGAGFWFWRRSKKAKQVKVDNDAPPVYSADAKQLHTPLAEVPADGAVQELSPDAEHRPELSAEPRPPQEKDADSQPPVELAADTPGKR